jgi:hypothetical protein
VKLSSIIRSEYFSKNGINSLKIVIYYIDLLVDQTTSDIKSQPLQYSNPLDLTTLMFGGTYFEIDAETD